MRLFSTFFLFFCILYCSAQDYQITQFNMPQLSDAIYSSQFLEGRDSTLWVFAYGENIDDVIMKYSDVGWQSIPGPCTDCFRSAVVNKEGTIYMAADTFGLFQYKNDSWTQVLSENIQLVFVDAYDQLVVTTNDKRIGKVIDNHIEETNNDNFPNSTAYRKVEVTNDNRMYMPGSFYEYCYERGWINIARKPVTLGGQFGFINIDKDTNDLIHYGIYYPPPAGGIASIGTFKDGKYFGANLLVNHTRFFEYAIDNENAVWTYGEEFLRRDTGASVDTFLMIQLFTNICETPYFSYSLFTDSNSNCWIFSQKTGEISVVHRGNLELNGSIEDDKIEVIELDCTTFTYDIDNDGYTDDVDCDDCNYFINPGADEIPYNGKDDDCNSTTLDNDLDEDGFLFADDCNDNNPNINPDQTEEPYNGIDDDCNSTSLDDDLDQDGFVLTEDCDDNSAQINPDAVDIPNNGIDEDCDGMDLLSSLHEIANTVVNIYPNPATDIINIEADGQIKFKANLYDLNGQLIGSTNNIGQILTTSIPTGTYLLEIEDINSDQRIIERIIIEK